MKKFGSTLVISAIVCLLPACGTSTTRQQPLTRQMLPRDMRPPTFVGDASQAVDVLCAWAQANQIAFSTNATTVIYVDNTLSVGSWDFTKVGLIQGFIEGQRIGTLVLDGGPHDFSLDDTAALAPLRAVIDHSGRWFFKLETPAHCSNAEGAEIGRGVLVNGRCVAVSERVNVPDDSLTGDFRHFTFAVPTTSGEQQMHVAVLSLYSRGRLWGRSILAQAFSGPLDVGTTSRACSPVLRPERFESTSTRQ